MIYIIHIGKCGGGSLKKELRLKNKEFEGCHCNKPIIKEKFKYIILIRDPINRFISAFNWKMFRCTTKEGYDFEDLKIQDNINEIEGYKYWKDINNFAENLYDKNGNINDMALKLIENSNHLHFDINYYLEEILPFLNRNNCDIIRYEYYHDDINKVFNIESISSKSHVYTKPYNKYISDKGIQNLRKFLEKDYNCFHKLRGKNIINKEYYQNILSGNFILKNNDNDNNNI